MPKTSAITEWSMTSSAGASGLTFAASPPRSATRLAHRGQVHHAGHAGEVLHDHPGRVELDLGVRLGLRSQPARARMCPSAVMFAPSSVRSRFSSSTFSE